MSAIKGVSLDPSDPIDQPIIARQVRAARQAGREGRDRAKVTRGRPDLETAYDEGAPGGDDEGQEEQPGEQSTAARTHRREAWQQVNSGNWGSFKPRSPTRPPSVRDAGGLLSGMLLYTVVIIYIRYGPAGWKGWLSAKFLNKPMTSAAASSAAGTGSAVKSI